MAISLDIHFTSKIIFTLKFFHQSFPQRFWKNRIINCCKVRKIAVEENLFKISFLNCISQLDVGKKLIWSLINQLQAMTFFHHTKNMKMLVFPSFVTRFSRLSSKRALIYRYRKGSLNISFFIVDQTCRYIRKWVCYFVSHHVLTTQ
jgi:hypothetical protein